MLLQKFANRAVTLRDHGPSYKACGRQKRLEVDFHRPAHPWFRVDSASPQQARVFRVTKEIELIRPRDAHPHSTQSADRRNLRIRIFGSNPRATAYTRCASSAVSAKDR